MKQALRPRPSPPPLPVERLLRLLCWALGSLCHGLGAAYYMDQWGLLEPLVQALADLFLRA